VTMEAPPSAVASSGASRPLSSRSMHRLPCGQESFLPGAGASRWFPPDPALAWRPGPLLFQSHSAPSRSSWGS
jgi:hypothetical protein